MRKGGNNGLERDVKNEVMTGFAVVDHYWPEDDAHVGESVVRFDGEAVLKRFASFCCS